MEINVKKFQTLLKKATVGFIIPNVGLKFDSNKMTSKMKNSTNTVIAIIDAPNDVITDLPDTLELNFNEPNSTVKPYINLIDADVAKLQTTDSKITLKVGKQRINLQLHDSRFISVFGGNTPRLNTFHTIKFNGEFKDVLNKVKRIAAKFERVYFEVSDGILYIETTDKNNSMENSLKFELGEVSHKDVCMRYPFKEFNAILSIVYEDLEQYSLDFCWSESINNGLLKFYNTDNTEIYYLLPQI